MSATSALEALARDAERFADDWPRDGARLIEDEARRQLFRDTGDGRFSRSTMGRGQVTVRAGRGSADVEARGGVWTWLEDGTRAHDDPGPGRQRARHPVRAAPGGPGPWRAPATDMDPGRRDILPQAERDAEQAFGRMVR